MKASDRPDPIPLLETIAALKRGVGPAASKPDRARYSYEAGWPSNVWSIGLDRIDLLGVDESGDLYWDGNRIEVRRGLTLTRWQRVGAIMTAAGAFFGGLGAAATAIHDWVK